MKISECFVGPFSSDFEILEILDILWTERLHFRRQELVPEDPRGETEALGQPEEAALLGLTHGQA